MPLFGEYFALCKFTNNAATWYSQVGTVLNKDQKQRYFCVLIDQIGVRALNKEHEIVAIRFVTQTVTL